MIRESGGDSSPPNEPPRNPNSNLFLAITLRTRDGVEHKLQALVDTGAEVSLVRRGVFDKYLREPREPIKIEAANQLGLGGRHREFTARILLSGVDPDTARRVQVDLPFFAYDASVDVDAIISFGWLAANHIDVKPRRHGILIHQNDNLVWVEGLPRSNVSAAAPPATRVVRTIVAGEGFEDYVVRPQYFAEITRQLKLAPTLDCFAHQGGSQCAKFVDRDQDALVVPWPADEVIWVNPPWTLWPAAAEKVLASECAGICIVPAWNAKWVRSLLEVATAKLLIERGTRLFMRDGKVCSGTQWGTWAVAIPRGARQTRGAAGVLAKVSVLPAWCKLPVGVREPEPVTPPQREKSHAKARQVRQLRMLDLFSGTGSVGEIFRQEGYEVVSVDINPRANPDIRVDVLEWRYQDAFAPGHFDVIFASPPCAEFSVALQRPRRLEIADKLVEKALEIIAYLKPKRWFLENPRSGLLKTRPCVAGLLFRDFDYCQFADWGYQKPTRIWGGDHLNELQDRVCDRATCANVVERPNGRRGHRELLGGNHMRYSRNQKYRVPERLVRYLNGFPDPEEVERVVRCLRVLQLRGDDRVTFLGEEDPAEEVFFRDTAVDLIKRGHAEHFIDSVVVVQEPLDSEEVEGLRRRILARYAETVFNPGPIRDPPVRGPFGEATIELKAGVTPVKQRMFQIQGSRLVLRGALVTQEEGTRRTKHKA